MAFNIVNIGWIPDQSLRKKYPHCLNLSSSQYTWRRLKNISETSSVNDSWNVAVKIPDRFMWKNINKNYWLFTNDLCWVILIWFTFNVDRMFVGNVIFIHIYLRKNYHSENRFLCSSPLCLVNTNANCKFYETQLTKTNILMEIFFFFIFH